MRPLPLPVLSEIKRFGGLWSKRVFTQRACVRFLFSFRYCGLQNKRSQDGENIFQEIFSEAEKIFLLGLSAEKSVFLPQNNKA